MQSTNIFLEPVSHPDLDTIEIASTLFPIGRSEPFFASLPPQINRQLSRRHARIFEEQGKVYLTDLHSRNGTRLNETSLSPGQPEVLRNGDIIELGGELSFKIHLDSPDDSVHEHAENTTAQLVLKPTKSDSSLEVIVVNQFPFLIARKDSVFERYSDNKAEELAQLSRRHAVVTLQDGDLFIEDMGSKNGTELNGQKLDERAVKIAHGDTLAFGGEYFIYTVSAPSGEQTESQPQSSVEAEDQTRIEDTGAVDQVPEDDSAGERTMFVDSPTSFLDIFCAEEENNAKPDPGDNANISPSGKSLDNSGGKHGKWDQARQQAAAIGQAFRGETAASQKRPKLIIAGIVAIIIVAAYFLYDSDASKIKTLSDRGDYLQAAQVANRYLANHPSDSEVEMGGTKALMHLLMPDWIAGINAGNFSQASELLKHYQTEYPNITDANEYLDLLNWVGKLKKFAYESGGMDGSIDIFMDEITMKVLLDEWDRSPNRHQQILEQISSHYPDFKPLQKTALSQLRQLRHGYSLYGQAIDELSKTAINAIENGDMENLEAEIVDYQRNYPRLAGLDALTRDAQDYATSMQLLAEADLGTLIDLQQTLAFETNLFQKHAQPLIAEQLPSSRIIADYETALAAWKNGEASQAIAILAPLTSDPEWTKQVTKQIDRMQQVDKAFTELSQSKQTDGQQDRLLDFRKLLKPSEDSFYIDATNLEFEQQRQLLTKTLDLQMQQLIGQWASYLDAGGINSVMRIDENISPKFKKQAGLLNKAYSEISAIIGNYELLQIDPPPEIEVLYREIVEESRRQRNWVKDLGVVMDQSLLQAKLELLPYPIEE